MFRPIEFRISVSENCSSSSWNIGITIIRHFVRIRVSFNSFSFNPTWAAGVHARTICEMVIVKEICLMFVRNFVGVYFGAIDLIDIWKAIFVFDIESVQLKFHNSYERTSRKVLKNEFYCATNSVIIFKLLKISNDFFFFKFQPDNY